MSTRIPRKPPHAKSSVIHSNGGKCPTTGSRHIGLDELAEGVDEGAEQQHERERREPVRDRDDRQPRHAGVPEELLEEGPGPGHRVVGAARVRLADPVERDEPTDLSEEQGPPDEHDREAERDGDDLERGHARESTEH